MDTETSSGSQHREEFVNAVAEKLGVAPDKVAAALQDVRKERMDQAITERIQNAVQNGVITQAEAGRIRQWWQSRPDGVLKLLRHMSGHGGRIMGFRGMGFQK